MSLTLSSCFCSTTSREPRQPPMQPCRGREGGGGRADCKVRLGEGKAFRVVRAHGAMPRRKDDQGRKCRGAAVLGRAELIQSSNGNLIKAPVCGNC